MDKRLDFTGVNPDIRLDQIMIDANANRPAMFAMQNTYSDRSGGVNYIIDGCVVTVGGSAPNNTWSLAGGYIFLNGELLQVDSQSGTFDSVNDFLAYDKVVTYNSKGNITYGDGTPRQTWQQNRGVITVQGSVSSVELDAINGERQNELVLFRKDVISASQTDTTIDFSSNEDLILVNVSGIPSTTPTLTVNNVVNGDTSKYIQVTKAITQNVMWANATDITNDAGILISETVVTYHITSKNGLLYAKALAATDVVESWKTPAYNAGYSDGAQPLQYRKNKGKLEIRGVMISTNATGTAFTLPTGYRPIYRVHPDRISATAGVTLLPYEINTSGNVSNGSDNWNTAGTNEFNNIIILD
jgi:hypothetical protein